MHRLFSKNTSGVVELNMPVLELAKPFKLILEKDKGSHIVTNYGNTCIDSDGSLHLQAKRVITYLYYYCAWDSPYYFDDHAIKQQKAIELSELDLNIVRKGYNSKWNPTEVKDIAIMLMTWQYNTSPSLALRDEKIRTVKQEVNILRAFNSKLEQLTTIIENGNTVKADDIYANATKLSVESAMEECLKTNEALTAIGKNMASIRKQLTDLENTVKAEMEDGNIKYVGEHAFGLTEAATSNLSLYL